LPDTSGWKGACRSSRRRASTPDAGKTQAIEMADKTSVSIILGQASGVRLQRRGHARASHGRGHPRERLHGRLMKVVATRKA